MYNYIHALNSLQSPLSSCYHQMNLNIFFKQCQLQKIHFRTIYVRNRVKVIAACTHYISIHHMPASLSSPQCVQENLTITISTQRKFSLQHKLDLKTFKAKTNSNADNLVQVQVQRKLPHPRF